MSAWATPRRRGDPSGKTRALEAQAQAEAALPGDKDLAEIRAVLEAL